MDEVGSTSDAAPEGDGASFLRRLVDILVSPPRAFLAIERRPGTWWQPVLLLVVVALVTTQLLYDAVIEPAAIEGMQAQGAAGEDIDKWLPLVRATAWAGGALAGPIIILVIAAVAHFVCGLLLGGSGRFVQSLSITAHAHLVGVVDALLRVPLMLARESPEVLIGPAVLLPVDMSDTFLFRVLARLDAFALWKLLLIGAGLAVVHRISPGRSVGVLAVLFVLYAVGAAALGGVFGGPG